MRQRVFFFSKRALPVFIRPWESQSSGVDQGWTTFFSFLPPCFRVWSFRDWRQEEEEDGYCGGMDPTGRHLQKEKVVLLLGQSYAIYDMAVYISE